MALALALGGCGGLTAALRSDSASASVSAATTPIFFPRVAPARPLLPGDDGVSGPELVTVRLAEPAVPPRDDAGHASPRVTVAQAGTQDQGEPPDEIDEQQYDPWEKFNEKMFNLNLKLDRYVLKPVARVYRVIIPEPFEILIANGFDNIRWVPRFINSLLQGKFAGAGREVARFLINSTAGIGGLFDPAKDYWGIRPSSEDFGQTLGVWGFGPGPYLIIPLTPPLTVRDGIGRGVDMLFDPLSYFIPFIWDRLGMRVGDTVNDRALNYELFQGVEETTLDLYSSVRHFYLKRRELQIKE